jgi:putative membrane protein
VPPQPERYLVVCVDRDDDLGRKAGLATPISGRDAVLSAATALAVADPEDADANALFAAVKKYDELSQKGIMCEVAIVCGEESGGFESDRKVRTGVESLLFASEYTGIVFVSDGGEDEQIIPVLQGMKPVVSVTRVTVKHSESVEQTYIVLGRYLRMLIFDPRYSRWALGVPGLIFILATVLIVFNQGFAALIASLLIIGAALFIRGFNLDRWVAGILSRGPYGYLRIFSTVTSLLVGLVGVGTGYTTMTSQNPSDWLAVQASPIKFLQYGGVLTGNFLQGSLLLVWVAIAIYTVGTLLAHVVSGNTRAWRDGVVLILLALLYFPVDTFAVFLVGGARASTALLVSDVLVGLAIIFGLTSVVVPRIRTRGSGATE